MLQHFTRILQKIYKNFTKNLQKILQKKIFNLS